ncbi:hypothetical protein C2I27_04195 [Priestia megaterium]|nr:hypothetical protein C2I27_04195 [Priestia megaterium]
MAFLESKYSNQVSAMRDADLLAPAQVTGLDFTVEQGRVNLSWTAVTTNADSSELSDLSGYKIYRKANAGDAFSLVGSVAGDELTFVDTTAKDGASFIYAVSAFDGEPTPNEGEKSADLGVKTVPSVPTDLSAAATERSINLNWLSVKSEADLKLNENLAGYNVYRSEVDGSGYEKIGVAAPEETTFEDSSVVGGTTYFYVITAFDNSL